MPKLDKFRVVTRGVDGQLRIKEYVSKESLMRLHVQIELTIAARIWRCEGCQCFAA